MKISQGYLVLSGILILLLGCQGNFNNIRKKPIEHKENIQEGEENNVNKINVFEFKHIDKAPVASEKQPMDKVIKIYFSEWSIDERPYSTAIDIEMNEIYAYPVIGRRGLRAREGIVEIEGAEIVKEILEKYDVQSWKSDYTFEDPDSYVDGYSWSLWLQYEDGTVEKHTGEGTDVENLTPEKFRPFVEELTKFVEEKLSDSEE